MEVFEWQRCHRLQEQSQILHVISMEILNLLQLQIAGFVSMSACMKDCLNFWSLCESNCVCAHICIQSRIAYVLALGNLKKNGNTGFAPILLAIQNHFISIQIKGFYSLKFQTFTEIYPMRAIHSVTYLGMERHLIVYRV